MAVLRYQAHGFVEINGVVYNFGSSSEDYSITGVTKPFMQTFAVGTSSTVKVFDSTLQFEFKFLWLQADYDLHVEFVTDDDASIGEVAATKFLAGTGKDGVLGRPMVIPDDTSYANYTVNFGGGTIDKIDTIRVRNLSTTDAAQCFVFAAG